MTMIRTVAILFMSSRLVAADYIYKTVLVRAAPGQLLELIELDIARPADYGLEKPVLIRHSQGDQWDLLMIIPIKERMQEVFE